MILTWLLCALILWRVRQVEQELELLRHPPKEPSYAKPTEKKLKPTWRANVKGKTKPIIVEADTEAEAITLVCAQTAFAPIISLVQE